MGRPNPEYLIPNSARTPQERKERAAKMGRASGEAKRRKKTMRQALEMFMYEVELDEPTKERLRSQGINAEEHFNHQMVITRSLIAKAEAGDVQAYNAICAMIGEKPAEKVEMSGGFSGEIKLKYVGNEGEEDFPSSEAEVDAERV